MSRRVDHAFVEPAIQQATLAWDIGGKTVQGVFGVMAEPEDLRSVAKICFVSWIIGPGEKIVLSKRNMDY